MSVLSDVRTLYHLTLAPVRGDSHTQRLERFYAPQARDYDAFRARLLPGREALWSSLPCPENGVWVDLGGGTGANLEHLGARLPRLQKVYVVDLSPSLLELARQRVRDRGWSNVEIVESDATQFAPPTAADIVTFSYSLTMMPDWFAAIDQACSILRPSGRVGVIDFYVSRKHPPAGQQRHAWPTRTLWPAWFALDNVLLSPDHVPYLQRRFELEHFSEHRGAIPYVPLLRPPYYLLIARKRDERGKV
jgi:S-adenosylmethionine-diacylgycerolhomoserine-N-methlytransferase